MLLISDYNPRRSHKQKCPRNQFRNQGRLTGFLCIFFFFLHLQRHFVDEKEGGHSHEGSLVAGRHVPHNDQCNQFNVNNCARQPIQDDMELIGF